MSNDKDDEFSRRMNQEAKDDLVSKNTTAICLEAARSTFLEMRRVLDSIRAPAGVLGAGAGQGEPGKLDYIETKILKAYQDLLADGLTPTDEMIAARLPVGRKGQQPARETVNRRRGNMRKRGIEV